jgi:hypothetical protein
MIPAESRFFGPVFSTGENIREQFLYPISLWVTLSPIFGEAAGAGGGEDSLAKALEDFGDSSEAFAGRVDLGEERFDFDDNPLLFGERRERHWNLGDGA